MKGIFGMFVGFMILMVIAYYSVIGLIGKTIVDSINEIEELVGREVVLKGDTLEIVDFSFINSTCTLDDGRVISSKYAEKKLIKNK